MKKKELLNRIETLEFQLNEIFFLERLGVEQIERLNNEVRDLQEQLNANKYYYIKPTND